MKKVLFFLPPTTGGAEKITTTYARMLDEEVFEVAFVIVGRRKGDVVHYIPEGSRIFYVPALNMSDFVWQKIFFLLKRERPDFVFSSITPINCHVIHAANKMGIKTIVRCNCAVERIVGRDLKLARKYYPKANLIIAQTEKMREELMSNLCISSGRVITLHNPIDKILIEQKANEENPFGQERSKNYVWVGRFNEIKNVDVLIKAFAKVVDKEPSSRLCLIGKKEESNEYYKMILSLVEELGIAQQIVFTGFQANPYKWIKNSDCLVLTSRSEASPNVVFESLFLGTPVVVSDCTPDLDLIVSRSNGFVVPIGDVCKTAEAMLSVKKEGIIKLERKPVEKEEVNHLFISV